MAVVTKPAPVSRADDPLDADASPELLIGGGFAVDVTQPLAGAGGGQSAFLAVDRRAANRTGLMALHVRPDAPARANALISLSSQTIEGVLTPLAHGAAKGPGGRMASFVICQPPPRGLPWQMPRHGLRGLGAKGNCWIWCCGLPRRRSTQCMSAV